MSPFKIISPNQQFGTMTINGPGYDTWNFFTRSSTDVTQDLREYIVEVIADQDTTMTPNSDGTVPHTVPAKTPYRIVVSPGTQGQVTTVRVDVAGAVTAKVTARVVDVR